MNRGSCKRWGNPKTKRNLRAQGERRWSKSVSYASPIWDVGNRLLCSLLWLLLRYLGVGVQSFFHVVPWLVGKWSNFNIMIQMGQNHHQNIVGARDSVDFSFKADSPKSFLPWKPGVFYRFWGQKTSCGRCENPILAFSHLKQISLVRL